MKRKIVLFFLLFSISFYGQNDMLAIIRHTDNDIVIPKDLKVVYRGFSNEITIDVPGCKSFTASGNGLELYKKNIYNLNPKDGDETIVFLEIVLKNNKTVTEKHIFKIRDIKGIVSNINNLSSNIRLSKKQLQSAIIDVEIPDKNVNLGFTVTEFKIVLPNQNSIQVKGDKVNKEAYGKLLKIIKIGDKLKIDQIKYRFSTGTTCGQFKKVDPIIISVY